ncbi:hypothetical protein [Tenacibaculum maritimum]|uniref:hypothetical protein n=1 Tax=Tenacibaculum maritimum TaxID=107401 RepID=UPI001E49BA89|nr:hypothetical protein [Tenacibaculum maritimum]MCD9586083.1 hypothetical protein [Tenacibaculum maritimum]MCD9611875.1 hypothetical protein [Tenacibaculum maritimum]MCD9621892.1 hypothetical protein [Tenacibaculum maritimum]MCD9628262.1 hypothetical protein [Tenacibaculum maritimum]MCD9634046.1 hypothetical protein [Tenacibaculum maritimum]
MKRFLITTTGSCFSEGSCFPSSEHVNGKSVDTIYKWVKKTDQKIINAMDKFHFAKILVGNKKYFSDFDNCEDGGENLYKLFESSLKVCTEKRSQKAKDPS